MEQPVQTPRTYFALPRALTQNRLWEFVLLVGICIPLFFIGLGVPPLIDPDEPVYAATGLAALHSGTFAGWWSPHYNGGLWFDKPPVTYWLIGLSLKLFGQSALAARLPSALCAVIVVILSALSAKSLWPASRTAGLWAGVAIATCLQTVVLARAAVTDMILAALLTGAFIGLWRWLNDRKLTGSILLTGLLTGLATLTKGPVAVVLIGGTALFYLLLTRQFIRLLSPILWLSLLIAIAVALPWYLSMVHLHGSLFVQGFLEANNLTRYLQPEHPQTSSFVWFLPVLLGFIFPWSIPLICAVDAAIVAAIRGERASLAALIWVGWVFLFFSFSQTKLLTYIYPLYPIAAALIGRWIDQEPGRWSRIVCGIVFSIVAVLIAVILPGYVARGNGLVGARPVLEQVTVVFVLSALGVIMSLFVSNNANGRWRQAVYAIPAACLTIFFPLVAVATVWHQSLPDLSMVDMSAYINHTTPPGQPVVALTLKKPSLVFYSARPVIFTDSASEAANDLVKTPELLCAVKTDFLPQLVQALPTHRYKIVLHSGPKYVLIRYQQ
jgi:4-amino-4-deoxy-L-arabinose transferase-like glycosyltransferase